MVHFPHILFMDHLNIIVPQLYQCHIANDVSQRFVHFKLAKFSVLGTWIMYKESAPLTFVIMSFSPVFCDLRAAQRAGSMSHGSPAAVAISFTIWNYSCTLYTGEYSRTNLVGNSTNTHYILCYMYKHIWYTNDTNSMQISMYFRDCLLVFRRINMKNDLRKVPQLF